jgi:hypothetical protein
MAKKHSPKPQSKAAMQKNGRKPAEAPEFHAPTMTEPPVQPEAPPARETPLEAAAPSAPEQPTAEPPAPEATPAEATPPVEVVPEAVVAEASAPATPKAKKAPKEAKPKKLSALDAAAKVLGEAGEPMTTKAMIEAMAAKGYWTSPGGKTPHATLYSAILREIGTKGKEPRFKKTERGKFAAV